MSTLFFFFFVFLFGGALGGWQESADSASETISEVINGRGGYEVMQEVISNSLQTEQNITGNVLAAAVSATLESIVRPQRAILTQMAECITSSLQQTRSTRPPRQDSREDTTTTRSTQFEGFVKDGIFPSDGWGVTKEENFQESECLASIWKSAAEEDPTIVLQHYSGASGFIRGYFSNPDQNEQLRENEFPFDARLTPSFVYSTAYQKDVFILLDLVGASTAYVEQMKIGAKAVLEGLYDNDYAQILTTETITLDPSLSCASNFLRTTESNKLLLNDLIDLVVPSTLEPESSEETSLLLFQEAYASLLAAQERGSNEYSNCQPVILYVSSNQPTKDFVAQVTTTNQDYGARIFTYAIETATDTEGYLGGGNIYDLSCENEGQWFDIQSPEELAPMMLQYQILIQRSRKITSASWFVRFYTYDPLRMGIGLIGSLPVYDPDSEIIRGVVVIEFGFSIIQEYLASLARGLSFAFLTTNQGDLLVHPSYRNPDVVQRLPLFYDCSLIESSQSFEDEVRGPLVTQQAGSVTVTVDRPLSRGDIGTEGITSIPVKTTFFWIHIPSLPFIVVLAYSDAELRGPVFEVTRGHEWVASVRTRYFWDDADAHLYLPPDFFDNLTYSSPDLSTANIFSLKYTTLADNYRTFSPTLATLARSEIDPDTELYLPDSFMNEPSTCKAFQTYINNLITPHQTNFGLLSQAKQFALMTSITNEYWREDYFRLCETEPACGTVLRYIGYSNMAFLMFPGFVQLLGSTITNSPEWLCRTRPWFQRAESNPGKTTLATPYLDDAFGGKISTVAKAVFADPSRPTDDREILGVVGIDYPYPLFHRQITEAAGCAFDRADVGPNKPLCYFMDNAGFIVISPDFLDPGYTTLGQTNSDTLPVTLAEPELATQLFENGVMYRTTFLNFKGSIEWLILNESDTNQAVSLMSIPTDIPQRNPIYTVNDTFLEENGGFFSGTLTKTDGYCTSGEYTVAPVEGTALYLIYIEGYDRTDSDDCREVPPDNRVNVTFETCEENDKHYMQELGVCPNADRRDSESEANRANSSKCNLERPPEVDFVEWDDPVAIAVVSVTCLLIVIVIVSWIIIFKYRNTAIILMASPVFIYLQFFGFTLGLCTIFLWTGEPTKVQCGLRPWIASIAFVLVVGPMFAKTYRIWRLFSGKGFFAQKISDYTVASYVAAMLVIPLILCAIWTGYEMPEPSIEDDHFDNDKVVKRCDGDNCRIFEGVMIAYCGSLLCLGTFFAFRARKADSHFNEARRIGLCIYSISFCGIIGVTLTYVLLGLPIAYYVVFCVAVWLGIVSALLFVYIPKMYVCILQPEKNTKGSSKGISTSRSMTLNMDD